MFKNVVLISLPVPFAEEPAMNPPLGLAYLSAYIRPHVDSIRVVDFATFDYDYFAEDYLKEIPLDADLYGISCTSPQFHWFKEVAGYLRQTTAGTIVAGGPHPTAMPEECREHVDFVVRGEGEFPLLVLIKKGVVPSNTLPIKDLDSLPFPDLEAFDLSRYKRTIEGDPAIHLVTLRGCPYDCAFCAKGTVSRKVRMRSIYNVAREIDRYIEKGYNSFVVYDDIFTLSRNRLEQFCSVTASRGIKWRCWSRTDLINIEVLQTMKDSGLKSITLGVESGDNTVLSNLNKQITAMDNRRALLAAKEVGVPVRCSLMYGCPGETIESLNNTLQLVERTQPDEWNLAVFRPVPGSPIWDNPAKYGVSFDKEWLKEQSYLPLNRFGDSGLGDLFVTLDTMTWDEYNDNLEYFVSELERRCPRKKIQDTIQTIKV